MTRNLAANEGKQVEARFYPDPKTGRPAECTHLTAPSLRDLPRPVLILRAYLENLRDRRASFVVIILGSMLPDKQYVFDLPFDEPPFELEEKRCYDLIGEWVQESWQMRFVSLVADAPSFDQKPRRACPRLQVWGKRRGFWSGRDGRPRGTGQPGGVERRGNADQVGSPWRGHWTAIFTAPVCVWSLDRHAEHLG